MNVTVTSEQKWVIGALGAAFLGAVPSFWMTPAEPSASSPVSATAGDAVAPKGDAVPIVESGWTPRSMSGDEQSALQETLKIDINHADESELTGLPSVGPASAKKIIQYREARGCFKDIEEIRQVKGFGGDAKFNAMSDHIRVDIAGCVFKEGDVDDSPEPSKNSSRSKKKSRGGGSSGLVNINTATAEELDALPGIGKATAQKIIDYRNDHGSFGSIEELMEVQGIKEGTFEKFKDLVTLN